MSSHLLKRVFDIRYPIIQAPMAGGITTPNLVSSVCNANALGFLAGGYLSADSLKQQIERVKSQTSKPFGVNIFICESVKNCVIKKQDTIIRIENEINLKTKSDFVEANLDEEIEKKIDLVIKHSVPIVSFTFGVPDRSLIQRLKENKVFLLGTACNITEALEYETLNFDAVVLQGSEAGGHRGSFQTQFQSDEIGLLPLLQEAKRKLKIPYFAAGGIATGDALLSCMILGAQGGQIGTGFLLTNESGASNLYKKVLTSTKAENTVITNAITGKKARAVVNKLVQELINEEKIEKYPIQFLLQKDLRSYAIENNLPDYLSFWCGQGIQSLQQQQQQTVEEFIQKLINEYKQALNETQNLKL